MMNETTYMVHACGDDGVPDARYPISDREFESEQAARSWIANHQDDLDRLEMAVGLVAHPYEARYHVGGPRMPDNALGFGARIVADVEGYRVVAVATEHATWLGMRLASGMWLSDDTDALGYAGYATRDEALACAQRRADLAVRLSDVHSS